MALDIQPLDIQPIGLDIQPLDIQPINSVNKGASSIPGAEDYDTKPKDEKKTKYGVKDALAPIEMGLTLGTGMLSGAAAMPLSLLNSAAELTKGNIVDPRKGADAFAEKFTYQPRLESIQELSEFAKPLLEGMQALGPTGYGASSLMSKTTRLKAEQARYTKAAEALRQAEDPAAIIKAAKEAKDAQAALDKVKSDFLKSEKGTQADLFGHSDTTGMASTIEPNQAPDPITPKRSRRQMAFNFDNETAPVVTSTPDGLINKELTATDLYARDAQEAKLVAELDAKRKAEQANERPNLTSLEDETGQQSLFDQGDQMGQRNQFNAGDLGDWRIDENGMPVRIDKSMEASNVQEPLQRGLWGDELGPGLGNDLSLTGAIDSVPVGVQNRQNGRFVPGNSRSNMLDRLEGSVEPGNDLLAAQQEAHSPLLPHEPTDMFQPTAPLPTERAGKWEPTPQEKLVKDAGYDIVPGRYQTAEGAAMVKNLQEKGIIGPGEITPIPEPVTAKAIAERAEGDTAVKAVEEYQPTPEPYKTPEQAAETVPVTAAQGPAVEQLAKVPGLKGLLKNFEPMTMPIAEFLEKFAGVPDIAQNIVQKAFNWTTKGATYMNERINDPYFKRATDRFKAAIDNSNSAVRDLIHSKSTGLAPLLRGLDRAEYNRLPEIMREAWRKEVDLTPEMLRGMGVSEKGITAVMAHKAYTNKLYSDFLKPAADLAGIKNVSQDVSYYASIMAGDYRVPVMQDGKVIDFVTSNTKWGPGNINSKVAAYKKLNPDAQFGDRQYHGGNRPDRVQGMSQLFEWLAEQDPEMAQFSKVLEDLQTKAASDFMGTKKHTMEKKGIKGFQGEDTLASQSSNAKDFWDAQVSYGENVIKWAEISKAMEEVKPLMVDPARPNSNALIKRYVDNAMGRNPGALGKMVDATLATVGDVLGTGTTVPRDVAANVKKVVNLKLLAGAPSFYLGNMLQQVSRTPELAATLKANGLNVGALGLPEMVKGMIDAATGKNKAAEAYAREHHVYSSDLFETSNSTRKDFGHFVDKASVPAAGIEQYTRKSFYLTAVGLLERNGYTGNNLYGTAHELTNVFMNNYNPNEARMLNTAVGGKAIGRGANNLMSYGHNEASRIAMHFETAVDGMKEGDVKKLLPLATNVITNIALAGIVGTMGYKEADLAVKTISEAMGTPTSLSAILTRSSGGIADYVKYGVPSAATGVDMTQSFGAGNVVPGLSSKPLDVLLPGASSVIDPLVSTAQAAVNPTEFNVKKAARDWAPRGPAQGLLDRIWFSKHGEKGEESPEMGINQTKITGQVRRNETDKIAKNFGMTGLNESLGKAQDFHQTNIDKYYGEKRQGALQDMKEALFVKNQENLKASIQKYIKNEGDTSTLQGDIEKALTAQSISAEEARLIQAQAGSLPKVKSLIRRFGK